MIKDYEEKVSNGEIKLISRAASILRVLGGHPHGLSLGQISNRTKLARATVQRLVAALETEAFVVADERFAGVRLAAELARLGAAVHDDMAASCRPFMQELCELVGESITSPFLMVLRR